MQRNWLDQLEETVIGALLGLMTVVTFANVIARFVFNSNILWALELTVFMFGWLVLLGASYAVKIHAHLGVDVIVNALPVAPRRRLALVSVACCLIFAALMMKGAYDYWAVFADCPLQQVAGFRLGLRVNFAVSRFMRCRMYR